MKKIFTVIFLALTICSFGEEKNNTRVKNYIGTNLLVTDEIPYLKEIIAINNIQTLDKAIVKKQKIGGFTKELTKEVEEEISNLYQHQIIYQSYLFTKNGVKVRVLYIDEEPEFKIK